MKWPDPAQGPRASPTACWPTRRGRATSSPRWPAACSRSRSAPCRPRGRIEERRHACAGARRARRRPRLFALAARRCRHSSPTRRAGTNSCARRATPTLGGVLKDLARTLPWFVEEPFAKALGPSSGSASPTPGGACSRFRNTRRNASRESAGSYARDEAGLIAAATSSASSRRRSTKSRRGSTRSPQRIEALAPAASVPMRCGTKRRDAHARPAGRNARQVQPSAAATTSRSASASSGSSTSGARIRSSGSSGPPGARQVDARGELPRGAQAAAACGSRSIPATPIPPRSSTTCAASPAIPLRRHAATRALPAVHRRVRGRPARFARRFMRELFALLPAGIVLVRRQLPRGRRPTRRGASRSPRACARFRSGSTSSFLSREPPSRVGAAGGEQRIARVESEALRFTRDETERCSATDGELDGRRARRRSTGASDGWAAGIVLMREHVARSAASRPRRLPARGQGGGVPVLHRRDLQPRAAGEPARADARGDAALGITPADAVALSGDAGGGAACSTTSTGGTSSPIAARRRASRSTSSTRCSASSCWSEARGDCSRPRSGARRSPRGPRQLVERTRRLRARPRSRCTSRRRRLGSAVRARAARRPLDCSRRAGARRSLELASARCRRRRARGRAVARVLGGRTR